MIKDNLIQIRKKIDNALHKRNDDAQRQSFKLVAVTKNHDVPAMREAIDERITAVGENRVQETMRKLPALERDVEWHLIGHLQTNKARQAVKLFDLIQSVDSERLAFEINRVAEELGKVQDILVQVNIAKEDGKYGIHREHLDAFLAFVTALPHIRLCGLMAIMPHEDDVERLRPFFREMRDLFDEAQARKWENSDMRWLSMGMTNDYEIALQEGANLVRIGTGIFGQRQY